MSDDLNKLIAAILTTMCRRGDSIPSVEQVLNTYDRMLVELRKRDEAPEK